MHFEKVTLSSAAGERAAGQNVAKRITTAMMNFEGISKSQFGHYVFARGRQQMRARCPLIISLRHCVPHQSQLCLSWVRPGHLTVSTACRLTQKRKLRRHFTNTQPHLWSFMRKAKRTRSDAHSCLSSFSRKSRSEATAQIQPADQVRRPTGPDYRGCSGGFQPREGCLTPGSRPGGLARRQAGALG